MDSLRSENLLARCDYLVIGGGAGEADESSCMSSNHRMKVWRVKRPAALNCITAFILVLATFQSFFPTWLRDFTS